MMHFFVHLVLLLFRCKEFVFGQGGISADCDPTSDGNLFCQTCPRGKYRGSLGGTHRAECIKCPRGKYGSMAGAESLNECTDCPLGRFNDVLGAQSFDDCRLCPPGKIGSAIGLISKECSASCPSGYFSREFGLTSDTECELCPENYRGWQCEEDIILRKGYFDSTSGHIGEEAHAYIGDGGDGSTIPQGASPIKFDSFHDLPLDNLASSVD